MQGRIDNGGKPSTRGTGSKVSGVARGLGGPWDARGFEAHVGSRPRVDDVVDDRLLLLLQRMCCNLSFWLWQ
jgi:hypothetical protein